MKFKVTNTEKKVSHIIQAPTLDDAIQWGIKQYPNQASNDTIKVETIPEALDSAEGHN